MVIFQGFYQDFQEFLLMILFFVILFFFLRYFEQILRYFLVKFQGICLILVQIKQEFILLLFILVFRLFRHFFGKDPYFKTLFSFQKNFMKILPDSRSNFHFQGIYCFFMSFYQRFPCQRILNSSVLISKEISQDLPLILSFLIVLLVFFYRILIYLRFLKYFELFFEFEMEEGFRGIFIEFFFVGLFFLGFGLFREWF